MRNKFTNLLRDTVALISHDDNSFFGKGTFVHIFAFQKSSYNRALLLAEPSGEIDIVDTNASEGTHRGLNDLGVIAVGGVERTEDIMNAKPIASADDRAEIARVLDAV